MGAQPGSTFTIAASAFPSTNKGISNEEPHRMWMGNAKKIYVIKICGSHHQVGKMAELV
jgi:hypothetical protein